MDDFCATADLYCSLEHLRQRVDVAAGEAVDVGAAAALGAETWADVKGARIEAGPD